MKWVTLLPIKFIALCTSEDLERFYFQYQSEALPHGESLQSFCVKNKVPYNIFQKWFKDTRKKVVEVQVDGAPEITHEAEQGNLLTENPINYSEGMADDQKDRYIQYLAEQNQDLRLTNDAMKLVLEDLSAERKAKSLQEKLGFANQERFGDRRQRIHSKAEKSVSDRQKEKDDYDGTDDTLRMDSVAENKPQEIKGSSGKGRDLSNRPGGYKTMGDGCNLS